VCVRNSTLSSPAGGHIFCHANLINSTLWVTLLQHTLRNDKNIIYLFCTIVYSFFYNFHAHAVKNCHPSRYSYCTPRPLPAATQWLHRALSKTIFCRRGFRAHMYCVYANIYIILKTFFTRRQSSFM